MKRLLILSSCAAALALSASPAMACHMVVIRNSPVCSDAPIVVTHGSRVTNNLPPGVEAQDAAILAATPPMDVRECDFCMNQVGPYFAQQASSQAGGTVITVAINSYFDDNTGACNPLSHDYATAYADSLNACQKKGFSKVLKIVPQMMCQELYNPYTHTSRDTGSIGNATVTCGH